jgi:transposase
LDNVAFHKGKKLIIPDNIALLFLPPYSPELNPAEKIWVKYKRMFTNKIFKTIIEIELFICEMVKATIQNQLKSTCAFEYVFLNHFCPKITTIRKSEIKSV